MLACSSLTEAHLANGLYPCFLYETKVTLAPSPVFSLVGCFAGGPDDQGSASLLRSLVTADRTTYKLNLDACKLVIALSLCCSDSSVTVALPSGKGRCQGYEADS